MKRDILYAKANQVEFLLRQNKFVHERKPLFCFGRRTDFPAAGFLDDVRKSDGRDDTNPFVQINPNLDSALFYYSTTVAFFALEEVNGLKVEIQLQMHSDGDTFRTGIFVHAHTLAKGMRFKCGRFTTNHEVWNAWLDASNMQF